MGVRRREVMTGMAAALTFPRAVLAADGAGAAGVVNDWYRLVLELVRHTATMSPPVASRAFAYLGVTAWEALSGPGRLSLAGQVTALTPLPARPAGLNDAAVLQAAMATTLTALFANTGPTGQRAVAAMARRLDERVTAGLAPDLAAASTAHGRAVAEHILAWSQDDGGAVIDNLGFPQTPSVAEHPQDWVPTSLVALQQAPLLPTWGSNRTFAMPAGVTCALPAPPEYSEDPGSDFYKQAKEVYDTSLTLTDEQKTIARFWSDDPMLSSTPPGHWVAIAADILEEQDAPADRRAEVMALLGITLADAFIACWRDKYAFNLLRPVTYIRRLIDKNWEPLLITPPFPEYPSGHSSQSGAAATVLTGLFGEGFAFVDRTHADEGMDGRPFPDFWTAARDAGISRLYGGIHFRAAIERGLDQGACVGACTQRLETRA